MLVEFYAFYNFIAWYIDFVEDVTADYCIDSFILASSDTVYCSTSLINSLRLSILLYWLVTEMFQVLMVPSWDPLTRRLFITNKFETRFVCPTNWFKIYPWFVKLHSTIIPSSKLPNTVFSVKQAETISSRICVFCYYSLIELSVLFFILCPKPRRSPTLPSIPSL